MLKGKDFRNVLIGFCVGTFGLVALAVTIPNNFSAGTTISASAVNQNFSALKTSVDTLEGKVAGFVHTVTASNLRDANKVTCFDNPATNGNPNLIVTATYRYGGESYTAIGVPVAVDYYASVGNKWCLWFLTDDSRTLVAGMKYNVIVLKP